MKKFRPRTFYMWAVFILLGYALAMISLLYPDYIELGSLSLELLCGMMLISSGIGMAMRYFSRYIVVTQDKMLIYGNSGFLDLVEVPLDGIQLITDKAGSLKIQMNNGVTVYLNGGNYNVQDLSNLAKLSH